LQISRIDASRDVPLYFLSDLLGHRVRGSYYREQLKEAPTIGKSKLYLLQF